MAFNNTSSNSGNSFEKELNKDINDFHSQKNSWSYARNAINNSITGDLYKLGNEPANQLCVLLPYTCIGAIHISADYWLIFSTDDTNSAIGIFQESSCNYTKIVDEADYLLANKKCLNFNKQNLIKAVVRATGDCTYKCYWADGNNDDRVIEVTIDTPSDNAWTNQNSPVAWEEDDVTVSGGGCIEHVNTMYLDCERIRLARLIEPPCIKAKKGVQGGTLINGSYMAIVAYAIKGQRISDWYISNVQPLFDHNNTACSLDVQLVDLDKSFDEILVGIVSITNQQTVARLVGTYNINQTSLSFDTIDNTLEVIPIEQLPLMNPIYNKSDAIYSVNDYLLRVGPTSKLDFNYQPLANQIVTKWQSVEYPLNYYRNGGNKANYLRDEIYSFFIEWVYDTGDVSNSYHIPGRPMMVTSLGDDNSDVYGQNYLVDGDTKRWQQYNTAFLDNLIPTPFIGTDDGGLVIAEGMMAYWESSETYPYDKPQIWDCNINYDPYNHGISSVYSNISDAYNLCNRKIRHHKFPQETTHPSLELVGSITSSTGEDKIRILGVKFENIRIPLINPHWQLDGEPAPRPVPNIVGYNIYRGSRNGNKTILAKGIINNLKLYNIEGGVTERKGCFQNYPYNDLNPDVFLSNSKVTCSACNPITGGGGGGVGYTPLTGTDVDESTKPYSQHLFSFHSPDTNFTNPYLSAKELKVYGTISGEIIGRFELSEKHPKEKLVTNMSFIISAIAGIGIASLAANGKKTTAFNRPSFHGNTVVGTSLTIPSAYIARAAYAIAKTAGDTILASAPIKILRGLLQGMVGVAGYDNNIIGGDVSYQLNRRNVDEIASIVSSAAGGLDSTPPSEGIEESDMQRIPTSIRGLVGPPIWLHYFTEGTDSTLRLIKALLRHKDFGLRYHSHCLYNKYNLPQVNFRFPIINQEYVGPQITDFGFKYRINNLYRNRFVALEIDNNQQWTVPNPSIQEVSRILASDVDSFVTYLNVNGQPDPGGAPHIVDPIGQEIGHNTTYRYPLAAYANVQIAASNYVAIKQRLHNCYGQINGIMQVPVSICTGSVVTDEIVQSFSSQVLFGGDTYIGRYTEKNTFFFFYDWLYDQPDGAEIDYYKHRMFPHPRFWANFEPFETNDFTGSMATAIYNVNLSQITFPNDYYNLDGQQLSGYCTSGYGSLAGLILGGIGIFKNIRLAIKDCWFYVFSSGVRDFYVESEVNVDLRDWGLQDTEQHYDPYRYTDTKEIFQTGIIKAQNYYKYDFSLSINKLFINYISWATPQSREYDPFLAETCYQYSPNRIIYSLPAQQEGQRDNWYIFLANNYKDFLSRITCVKPVSKNGALIFFKNESPVQLLGVDTLQTDTGTKLSIGDGGLFAQPLQNLINSDKPYEYGSCQDRLSVINTPIGTYWISQNQGKVFHLQSGIEELTMQDLKWWFASYLPYRLTAQDQFPNFELVDNPVIGVGCQSIYDNENNIVYFSKRDFKVLPDLINEVITYVDADNFLVNGMLPIKLGDPRYFEDCSWTISYDTKIKSWISYHDWHPSLSMPGKNTFMTIHKNEDPKSNSYNQEAIWVHNTRYNKFCNYYGLDYPFEIEYIVNTVQAVNSLKSVEYNLEVFKYAPNYYDRFHVLDFNFDEAVIYNSEQVSGKLNLILTPKNSLASISFPNINIDSIDILYSKVEQKYRFNTFWDITDDRGEYSNAQRMIMNTEDNGYVRTLNPQNMNYQKDPFQRKKFRHYQNTVWLKRRICDDKKMMMLISTNKNLYSPR